MLPSRRLLASLWAAAIVAALSPAAGAETRYEEFGAFPGQSVTNTVQFTTGGGITGTASATFEVAPLPSRPRLRVFEAAHGRPRAESIRFHRTDMLTGGDFAPLDPPTNGSAAVGGVGPIGLSGPLEVLEVERIRYGVPLFYVLTYASLNLRSDEIETADLAVVDDVTGDEETIRLYETGPDTGEFGGWIDTRRTRAAPGDGVLSTTGYSFIDGTWTDPFDAGRVLSERVLVGPMDPQGLIYDSATGAPVDGARVTLVDVRTGRPARVWGNDLRARYPATVTSGGVVTDASGQRYRLKDGEYRFPYVEPGTYRIEVVAPDGYLAPSARSDEEINAEAPEGMEAEPGSRGEEFEVSLDEPVVLGIPVDRQGAGSVERDGSLSVAEGGDFITYTVTIEPPPVAAIDITDLLLPEVEFVPGTLRIDGEPVVPRLIPDGFVVEEVPVDGREVAMTYLAQVSLDVEAGDSLPTTTVVTEALTGAMRMSDDHVIGVEAPFGEDETVILGQVIAGACGEPDREHDLSGIRILLESGDVAVTDAEGRFHFQGIAPRPHVVQLDRSTLPRHAEPVLCRRDTRNAGSPISQFVDLRPGMMARAEFHLAFDEAALDAEIAEETGLAQAPEIPDPAAEFDKEWLARQGMDPAPALLSPAKGWTPGSDAIDIVALKPAGAVAELRLNGELVAADRLDQPIMDPLSGATVERWHALRIEGGRNHVSLTVRDAEGQEILFDERTFFYETVPFRAELVTAGSVLESDGRTTPVLQLRVLARSGEPLRPGTRVQFGVAAPYGFENPVERESQPTSQRGPMASTTAVVGEDGLMRLRLAAVRETGTAHVTVMAPDRRPGQEIVVEVPISAAERPWVLVGLAEGTVAERTIRDHMHRSGDIGNDLAGRVSLFAEGVVAGRWLLTLRLDTARDGEGPFSVIDPERDYVVYGDASAQDDASPSRFPLYLRLKSEEAEVLVGDFTAEIDTRLVDLSREVTGLRVLRETATTRVMVFAARTTQRWVEDRIAVDGTSGPYRLSRTDVVPTSETVTLLEVDGDDLSRVLSEEALVAGQDYVLSAGTGTLFLRRPVPAFTPEMNRFVLKVGYETDEDIEAGLLAGIRAERQLGERVRVGATMVHAGNANGGTVDVTLFGADVALRLNEALTVGAEALVARRADGGLSATGRAAEVFADYDDGTSTARLWLRRQQGDTSLDSTMDEGRVDSLGAEGELRLWGRGSEEHPDDGTWLAGEVHGERDRAEDRRTAKGEAEIVRRSEGVETAMGLGFFGEEDAEGERGTRHATMRLAWSPDEGRLGYGIEVREPLEEKGDLEAERDLRLEVDFEVSESFAVNASLEQASQTGQDGARSGVLALGGEWSWGETGEVHAGLAGAYGEGSSGQAVFLGLDKAWELAPGLQFKGGLDVQRDLGAAEIPLGLSSGNPWIATSFTTARAGLRYTAETWSLGVDVEGRTAPEGQRANIRLSGDGEIGEGWTFGAEARHGVSDEDGEESRDTEAKVSFAHRLGETAPITLLELEAEGSLEDGVDTRRLQAAVLHSRYLGEVGELTLRGAVRAVETETDGVGARDTLGLLGAEYRHDLSETWDIGFHGTVARSARTGDTRTSLGVSVGMTPFENGYLEVGYNAFGFADEDFSEHGSTDKGLFLEYRVKFDQDTFREAFR